MKPTSSNNNKINRGSAPTFEKEEEEDPAGREHQVPVATSSTDVPSKSDSQGASLNDSDSNSSNISDKLKDHGLDAKGSEKVATKNSSSHSIVPQHATPEIQQQPLLDWDESDTVEAPYSATMASRTSISSFSTTTVDAVAESSRAASVTLPSMATASWTDAPPESILEAKAAIHAASSSAAEAASLSVRVGAVRSGGGDLLVPESSHHEEQLVGDESDVERGRPLRPHETPRQLPQHSTTRTTATSPTGLGLSSLGDEIVPTASAALQPQSPLNPDDGDEQDHSSLPTVATARAIPHAERSRSRSSTGSSSEFLLDEERARFRQQIRDSLAAQAVQAHKVELIAGSRRERDCDAANDPTTSLPLPASQQQQQESQQHAQSQGQAKTARQKWLWWSVAVLSVVFLIVVTTTTVVLTRQSSPTVDTPLRPSSPLRQPALAPSGDVIAAPTIPVVLLPDGRHAFTQTSQLYQAVDDYDAALQANDTAQGSLVALQYGYPMGTWDVSRLSDFSRVFNIDRVQQFDLDIRLAPIRMMTIPDLSGWNVSRATTMKGMFAGTAAFAGDGLADWDVGLVTDFSYCFSQAAELAADLSQWNTSSARDMSAMFHEATSFDGDLSLWDVARVESIAGMFSGAYNFQGGDLSRWNVSQVRDFSQAFFNAWAFNGDISTWDTHNVENVALMFQSAYAFSGDLSRWSTEKMNSFRNMFTDATSFVGGDLGGWKTSRVTNMLGMFLGCDEFNGNVSTWDVSRVVTFETTFEYCPRWVVGDLSQWKPSGALNMVKMFKDAHAFNSNLSAWNVSRVTDMTEMFHNADAFDGDLSGWDVANLEVASSMFLEVETYNQSLCPWRHKLPTNAVTTDMFSQTGCTHTSDPQASSDSSPWLGPFCSACADENQ